MAVAAATVGPDLSESFRALGDPTRLRILRLLAEAPLNVSELVSLVGIGQSSVSHHLSKLRALDLIGEHRQGGFTYYSLVIGPSDSRWPLIELARRSADPDGDRARLVDLLRQREDRQALNERLLEPGQSWFLWAVALSSLLPPLEVADFGCGTGLLSVSMAHWAKRVVAIDKSEQALAKARERAAREKVRNVVFLREDLHRLSLKAGSLDLVVLSQSLHHVEDPPAVLREAARILRRSGKVVLLELMPHQQTWVKDRLGHVHLGFEPGWLEQKLKAAGFGELHREIHARAALPPADGKGEGTAFRVFLLTGVKR